MAREPLSTDPQMNRAAGRLRMVSSGLGVLNSIAQGSSASESDVNSLTGKGYVSVGVQGGVYLTPKAKDASRRPQALGASSTTRPHLPSAPVGRTRPIDITRERRRRAPAVEHPRTSDRTTPAAAGHPHRVPDAARPSGR
jgi:hypothetical protein